jgi:N-methylhydantoinase A/oxoprolinase/acetone carboxylase beta subunit
MIGVDVGGTFTDVVAVRDGQLTVTKVPSDAAEPAAAVIEGARRLGVEGSAVFNHASTMGLNASTRAPAAGATRWSATPSASSATCATAT